MDIAQRAAEVRHERRSGRLRRAAIGGRVHDVETLLQRGADVNYVRQITPGYTMLDPNNTPLHAAAAHGQKAVVDVLIAAGADLDRRTVLEHSGRRIEDSGPIHVASENDHQDILEVLLLTGAEVDLENATGDTALHIAASKGLHNILDRLLHAGAQVNYQNQSGCTVLHEAAAAGHEHVAKSLIEAGGDPGIRNKRQETPLESARRLSSAKDRSVTTSMAELLGEHDLGA